MMKKQTLLSFVLVFATAQLVIFALFSTTAQAIQGDGKPSASIVKAYKKAAYKYWSGESGSKNNMHKDSAKRTKEASKQGCSPGKVKVKYFDRKSSVYKKMDKADRKYYSETALAFAWYGAAYKKKTGFSPNYYGSSKEGLSYFCKEFWNYKLISQMINTERLAEDETYSKGMTVHEGCMAFIHEYGHLLGYEHNQIVGDIMWSYEDKETKKEKWKSWAKSVKDTECDKITIKDQLL